VTGLVNNMDYYWRIDEIQPGSITVTGDIWHFRTIPTIPITDPTLVGWWKFDEGPGKAIDWSGLNQHGTVYGDAESVSGYDGGAIDFDYIDNYVELPIGSTIASLNSATFAIWVTFPGTGETFQRIFNFGYNDATVYMFLTPNNGSGVPYFAITTTGSGGESGVDAPNALPSGWHHIAITINGATHAMELYINGVVVAGGSTQALPSDIGNTIYNWLGRSDDWVPPNPYLIGSLDDFRIYNYAKTQNEISKVMRGGPLIAWNPRPSNQAITDVEKALPLRWSPGDEAVKHDVYFSTDYAAVDAADASDTTNIYRGQQDANSYIPIEGVEPNQVYYWRIDEINADATISRGRIWSFTVTDYLIVDDFEDYNDYQPDRIFDTWIDGWGVPDNGSQVGYGSAPFAERTIVNSGFQSMPFFYNNTGGIAYSEAVRTFDSLQDWTRKGIQTLTLFFRGYPQAFVEDPAGTYMMSASGADVWGLSDQFRYAYKRLSGNGSITARVVSVENTNEWAKAGVMIREMLDDYSTHGFMLVTPDGRRSFQNRQIIAETSYQASSDVNAITLPLWVKVVRQGNNFTGYYSENGINWIQQPDDENTGDDASPNPQNIVMSQNVYIGLAYTSHNINAMGTAVFDNVTTTGTVPGDDWQVEAIGADMPVNEAQPLYVVVRGGGVEKTVEHPDNPNAVLQYTWQQWDIPLSVLSDAGVTLSTVQDITIGVGSQNGGQGGTGRLYFDDIRLYLPTPPEPNEPNATTEE